MIEFDGQAMLLGLLLGLPVSAFFFAGLAWGMRRALRARHPAPLLLLSFLLRAGVLLGAGLWLTGVAQPLSALPAYMLAFLLVRTAALRWARRQVGAGTGSGGEARWS